jgi:hypothetical protein
MGNREGEQLPALKLIDILSLPREEGKEKRMI